MDHLLQNTSRSLYLYIDPPRCNKWRESATITSSTISIGSGDNMGSFRILPFIGVIYASSAGKHYQFVSQHGFLEKLSQSRRTNPDGTTLLASIKNVIISPYTACIQGLYRIYYNSVNLAFVMD